jgi:putative colanic acid biosynthesis acetyltransferase WcaF
MTKILPDATGADSQAPGGRSFRSVAVRLSAANRLARVLWRIVWITAFRLSPTVLHGWRRLLLRAFGARIAPGARPYPRARIWAPWNLVMEAHSCIADDVDCYCVAAVTIGTRATVSQYSYLCSASHDYRDPAMPLIVAPIVIEAHAWVAADVFVGPGVKIGEGAVVGARSTVVQDVAPWTVVAGSPAVARGSRPKLAGVTGLQ